MLSGSGEHVDLRVEESGVAVGKRLIRSIIEYMDVPLRHVMGRRLNICSSGHIIVAPHLDRNSPLHRIAELRAENAENASELRADAMQKDGLKCHQNLAKSNILINCDHLQIPRSQLPSPSRPFHIQSIEIIECPIKLSIRLSSPVFISLTAFATELPPVQIHKRVTTIKQLFTDVAANAAAVLLTKSPRVIASLDLLGNPGLGLRSLRSNFRRFLTSPLGLASARQLFFDLSSTGVSFVGRISETLLLNMPNSEIQLPMTMRNLSREALGSFKEVAKMIVEVVIFPVTGVLAILTALTAVDSHEIIDHENIETDELLG